MTDTEGKNEQEKLLTSENDDTPSKELDMLHFRDEDDGWKSYSKFSKFLLFFFFFWIGIINHLGTILVMNGGRILAMELGVGDLLTLYTSGSTVFAILTRLINSKLCLKVSYKKRVWIICFWMMAGYITMYAVLELHSTVLSEYNILCFVLSFIPCFFLGSSYAFGEAAMVAYLRLFPKTLLAGWSSGTGLSGLVSGSLNFTSQLIDGFSLKYLYLILVPVGFVYLLLFICTFRILKSQERKMQREERMSKGHMTIIRDSSNNKNNADEFQKPEEEYPEDEYIAPEEEEDQKSIREAEDRDMEEMNKTNQVISLQNFKKVMGMVGRVIINLGLIYFLQFLCVNCIIVYVCNKYDISFLPEGCSKNGGRYRRGKFEFINLSYQLGMFLSKTFIKIVRRIQPIEVYTSVIVIIIIIYIIQIFKEFMHWGVYLVIGLILGFFSGGTYAGGFYTILNSDRVPKNYKELTVNIATIFNDSGTFLSGILGFILNKTIMKPVYFDMGRCDDNVTDNTDMTDDSDITDSDTF